MSVCPTLVELAREGGREGESVELVSHTNNRIFEYVFLVLHRFVLISTILMAKKQLGTLGHIGTCEISKM